MNIYNIKSETIEKTLDTPNRGKYIDFGKNPNKELFAKGYDGTISSDVAITSVKGNKVFVRLWATEQTDSGKKLARFDGTYTVTDGVIKGGKLRLIERK